MFDTRKSGLFQHNKPSLSRNELYVSQAPAEIKPTIRGGGHSHVDPHALPRVVAHRVNNESVLVPIVAPRIIGDPKDDEGILAGLERLINGSFTSDTDWIKGTGWTLPGTVANSDAAQVADSDLTQTPADAFVQNRLYTVVFTVSNYVGGNITAVVGGTEGTDRAADGTFTENIVAGAGADFDLRADLDFDGDVDNVSVKRAGGTVKLGGTLKLSCGAVSGGKAAETYQWQLDAGDVVGATDAIIVIASAAQADAGVYTCDVTNAAGTTSSAGLTVTVI